MSDQVEKLTIPHLRVLEVLYQSAGLLSRGRIAERIEKEQTYVGRVIGYSDPVKRAKYRQTDDGAAVGVPLLDRGYVREKELDIDGLRELVIELTDSGRQAYLDNKQMLKDFLMKRALPKTEKPKKQKVQLAEEDLYSFEQVSE